MIISYLPLEKWRKDWRVNGKQIVCRHCKTVWDLAQARRPFAHAHDCQARRETPQYPLQDLRRIRDELTQAGLRQAR